MGKTSLIILSYQPIVMDALLRTFKSRENFMVVGSTGSSQDAEALAAQSKPDVMLLDCGLPDRGLTTMQKIQRVSPVTKIVIFTGIESAEHAVRSLDAGAVGYLSSACTRISVPAALDMIVTGQTVVSPHIATKAIGVMRSKVKERQVMDRQQLSSREEQIAKYLLRGWTNRAIVERVGLTEKTIKHYMSSLMQKFNAKNRVELAMTLPKSIEDKPRSGQTWLQ